MMADGRNHLRATHPARLKAPPAVTVQLSLAQYSKLYERAALAGVSMSQAMRDLIEGADQ